LLVLSAVVTTVYVSSAMQNKQEEQGYQNITFTDAVLTCEKDGRSEFGADLSQIVVDRHSSRYDNNAFVYKIFLMAYTKGEENKTIEYFVTCYVKASNGRISKFEVFENAEVQEGEAIKRGGDKFIEWPQ